MSKAFEETKALLHFSHWMREVHPEAYDEYLEAVDEMAISRWFPEHHPEIIEEWNRGGGYVPVQRAGAETGSSRG